MPDWSRDTCLHIVSSNMAAEGFLQCIMGWEWTDSIAKVFDFEKSFLFIFPHVNKYNGT